MEARKILTFDIATMSNATFSIGDFCKWGKVAITAEWSGLDKTDAVISFKIRNTSTLTWETIPLLQYTIVNAAGSQTLEHREFASAFVGIDIDKGTNTAGSIDFYVFQKD